MKHLPFSNQRVDQVGVAVELVLNDIVEHFQKEKYQVMVIGRRQQEPRSAAERCYNFFFTNPTF